MDKINNKIKQFKLDNNMNNLELHFSNIDMNKRIKFFNYIKNSINKDFKIFILVFDKSKIYSEFLKKKPNKFYNFSIKNLLNNINIDFKQKTKIVLDKSKSKTLEKELNKYIKNNIRYKITEIKSKDSEKDLLLQLADMFVSCIGHSYNKNTKNKDIYKDTIKDKIVINQFC